MKHTIFGSVSNSGKILAPIGIVVKNSNGLVGVASAGAAINNNGTITASIDGILIENGVAAISGGISNSGAITARTGIAISNSTVDGPIVDSGTIRATSEGILIDSARVVLGGIQVSSKGVISAGSSGIVVENTATFGGGITNNGKIAALGQHGILVSNVAVVGTGGPGGGITNTGAISVSNAAIEVSKGGGSFAGGISNSGKLTAAGEGIFVESIGVFGNASAGGALPTAERSRRGTPASASYRSPVFLAASATGGR